MKNHLPVSLQPIVAFAYITGWRTPSEILTLEWRHVDLTAGEVRLDPGTTKNDDGRVFPLTRELRRVLDLDVGSWLWPGVEVSACVVDESLRCMSGCAFDLDESAPSAVGDEQVGAGSTGEQAIQGCDVAS